MFTKKSAPYLPPTILLRRSPLPALHWKSDYSKDNSPRCKTCKHWYYKSEEDWRADQMCQSLDPDTFEPMDRGFQVRVCKQPTQTFYEPPVERDGFGLCDGSQFSATLYTAEDFGCVKHESL